MFCIFKFNSLMEFVSKNYTQKVSANISITFHQKSLTASSVIAALLFSSSVVMERPGSPATWFRAGLQCTGVRVLVGVWMHKSSFLLCPCLFFEPEQRVATAMRLVCLPLRGLGRAAACPDIYTGWRKQRRWSRDTQTFTHIRQKKNVCLNVHACAGEVSKWR